MRDRGRFGFRRFRVLAVALLIGWGLLGFGVGCGAAPAPSTLIHAPDLERLMARQRMDKRQLLKESLALTESRDAAFWPLYYRYQGALIGLYDEKLSLIARFDAEYPAIPARELEAMIGRYLQLKAQQIRLLDDYFHRISRQFDPVVAARFVQIETAWNGSFDLKLVERLPLAPGGTSAP